MVPSLSSLRSVFLLLVGSPQGVARTRPQRSASDSRTSAWLDTLPSRSHSGWCEFMSPTSKEEYLLDNSNIVVHNTTLIYLKLSTLRQLESVIRIVKEPYKLATL